MKFYRVHLTHDAGESAGYEYFASRRLAEARVAEWYKEHKGLDADDGATGADIYEIWISPTKAGILEALNRYASHNDNG